MHADERFNLGRWPSLHVRWRPDQTALVEGTTRRTYRELAARVDRLGYALQARGVQFGDRVALLLPNRVETIELILACARIGAIAVPLNFRLVARELAFMLRDSGAKLLFWDASFQALVDGLKAEELPPDLAWVEITAELDAFAESVPPLPARPTQPVGEDTPHLIMYTAGTTGLPKGVVLTHGNTFWQTMNAVNLGIMPGVVGLATLPLFHVGGLNGSVLPLLFIGGTVVIQRQFSPLETLALIQEHKVQGMVGVPAMFQMMAAMPTFASADLSSVIAFTSGGAPLPLHTIELYRARGIVFRQGYGLTEAAPGVTGMEPQDAYVKVGSVGRPCHHTEVRVVDEQDARLPARRVGRGHRARPEHHARLLEPPDGERRGLARRLAAHRRRRPLRRRRVPLRGRAHQGDDHHGRGERLPRRGRERSGGAPRCGRRRGHRHARREVGAAAGGLYRGVAGEAGRCGFAGGVSGGPGWLRYKHPREYHFVRCCRGMRPGKVVRGKLVEMLEGK